MAGCDLLGEANGAQSTSNPGADRWVWVDDAARPAVTTASLARLWNAVGELRRSKDPTPTQKVGAILAMPLADTLKSAAISSDRMATVAHTVDRSLLWAAQTPQAFMLSDLRAAYASHHDATDEASAMEAIGAKVVLVMGDAANFKVTQPHDFQWMEAIMSQAEPKRTAADLPMAIGQGFDVHALAEGRPLIIGGVEIPYDKGLLGHSDADVLLHAITDAILGAACMGDIGRHFPDTDPAYRGADSKALLTHAVGLVSSAGWRVARIDATVIAQAPKIAPYAASMQQAIGQCCSLDPACVNIKGKTTESLGFTGRGEGIAAQAVVMLARRPGP
jgi:2-C-methyl-D-erythritol 2,4-cyclodiphosphate synthase